MTQDEKAATFRALHSRDGAFVLPNPWNAGSARLLAHLGFEALATTSAGLGFSVAKEDSAGGLSREEILENARVIVEATALPVTADLENGFGHTPEACAETIRLATATGLVGGSIEDASGDPTRPIYDHLQAVERVQAAVEAARGRPFVLTARAENYLHGRPDLDDTIKRLQAFEAAGAEVLYAPGLPDLDAIRAVCQAVSRPVNVVMGLRGPAHSVAELAEAGVKRISTGGSLARAAFDGLVKAATEIKDHGSFTYGGEVIGGAEIFRLIR
ncbi:MAG: isocitrate lyase/phosphoenolpyruvate mutase family protein [Alphaproteobacteria bacterium]|nr:isocitrate lyase/phosphoenolpyruvate mutase family protein [Alphaproteobacteria bacterium]